MGENHFVEMSRKETAVVGLVFLGLVIFAGYVGYTTGSQKPQPFVVSCAVSKVVAELNYFNQYIFKNPLNFSHGTYPNGTAWLKVDCKP